MIDRPDSPRYREYDPCPELRPYVQCFWSAQRTAQRTAAKHSDAGPSSLRVLPDGCTDIIFDACRSGYEKGAIVGTMSKALLLTAVTDCHCIAVRFRPGAATCFLGLPAIELTDSIVSLDQVDRSYQSWDSCYIANRMADQPTDQAKSEVLQDALRQRLRQATPLDHRVMKATRLLNDGARHIAEIARDLNLSRQSLAKLFRTHVGVSPKVLERVFRLQRTLEHVEQTNSGTNWTQAAIESGYFDQSHFANDCRRLTEVSAKQLLCERRN